MPVPSRPAAASANAAESGFQANAVQLDRPGFAHTARAPAANLPLLDGSSGQISQVIRGEGSPTTMPRRPTRRSDSGHRYSTAASDASFTSPNLSHEMVSKHAPSESTTTVRPMRIAFSRAVVTLKTETAFAQVSRQ